MNRIVITIILLGSLCLLSGCIEVSHKTEWSAKLSNPFEKKPTARPVIKGNGYPHSPRTIPALLASVETLEADYPQQDAYYPQPKSTEPKRRGFKKFKKREN